MSTAIEAPRTRTAKPAGELGARVVLYGVSWETYERLARDMESAGQHTRLTYDRGALELMSPSPLHERLKKLIGRLVEDILVGLRIPFEAAGESRWRREAVARGLEADECFFLTPEKMAIVGGRPADREDDPLPDLAIEIDLEAPKLDRPGIYAALGVPEVWRYNGEEARIDHLRADGTFERRSESAFLPIRDEEIVQWLERAAETDFLAWIDQVQAWVRDVLVPRRDAGRAH